jgi:hypothetical protein
MTDMLASLEQMTAYVEQALNSLGEEVQPLMVGTRGENLDINLRFFFLLKKLKEHGENIAKLYNVCENELASRINMMIEQAGLESVDKVIAGERIRITPETKYYINCKAENKPALIAWMKSHPIGKELVKEDVHAKTLEKFIKNDVLGAGQLPPDGLVSLHQTQTITTRKLAK